MNAAATGIAVAAPVCLTQMSAYAAPARWDKEADIVVVGAGAAGLPAAIEAVENKASVIVIEANRDVGGHAILSGGNVPLGGGTSAQKKHGIIDSADLIFSDLTDWSVVQSNGAADYRFNDRDIVRAFADKNVETYEWLVRHGVLFIDRAPDGWGGVSIGNSAPREMPTAVMSWPLIQTGKPVDTAAQATTTGGVGLIRPLEAAARKLGVPILMEHRMTSIIRPNGGSVAGITVDHKGRTLNIRARKGVIVATGGHSSNVNFRRIFDPRLTEEYCGVAGEPYSYQDASGEIAAMSIGASLWGTANQTGEFGFHLTKPGRIGCQYGYTNLAWEPASEYFSLVRASGLLVRDSQNLIYINQIGARFCSEAEGQFDANNWDIIKDYVPHNHRNASGIKFESRGYLPAAMGSNGGTGNGGGPIWAIFDADAVKRENWDPNPPHVDREAGFFFVGNSMEELSSRIKSKYQKQPIAAGVLEKTIARYNSFVDAGHDADFAKPSPKYKIQTPPFYTAWATPVLHDSRAGLRINAHCQVQDLYGNIIPGLYCGGESAGGFSEHGLARCVVQGLIAGKHAAIQASNPKQS
jgi:succinate dehydrogenase/fumarate reductase flavoprotein subunit